MGESEHAAPPAAMTSPSPRTQSNFARTNGAYTRGYGAITTACVPS